MELCSCTSSLCSSGEDNDSKCDSNSEEDEICFCTCQKQNHCKKSGKSETVISVKKVIPRNKKANNFERGDNTEFKKEFYLAKKLLNEFLKKFKCKKSVDDICKPTSCTSIKTTVKNVKSDSEVKVVVSSRNLLNKKKKNFSCDSTSSDSGEYYVTCTCQDHKYDKNKTYKKAAPRDKSSKKFLIADVSAESENDNILSRIKKEMKKIKCDDYSSSDEFKISKDDNNRKWCKNNNNVNFNLTHDRVLSFKNSFKSNPCPSHEVYVTEMRKFKNILNCLNLKDNDFTVIPGVGPIYNKRIKNRFKNIKQLLETANMMTKEDFKGLLKCYANVNCYYGEMIYNSCIEYTKLKNIFNKK